MSILVGTQAFAIGEVELKAGQVKMVGGQEVYCQDSAAKFEKADRCSCDLATDGTIYSANAYYQTNTFRMRVERLEILWDKESCEKLISYAYMCQP